MCCLRSRSGPRRVHVLGVTPHPVGEWVAPSTRTPTLAATYMQNSPRTAAGFRSNFAPSDAGTRGTGRNGRGRRVTGGTVGWPFVHVTADERGRAGRGGDARGAGGSVCKIAG